MLVNRPRPSMSSYRPYTSAGIIKGAMEAGKYLAKAYNKSKSKSQSKPTRKPARRKPVSGRRKKKSLKKQVKQLASIVKNTEGTLTYIDKNTARLLASANQNAYLDVGTVTMANYETVLGQLRFFDPSNPGTFITGSGATGTYSREYMLSYYVETQITNNYQIPVEVSMYNLSPKVDTSIAPATAYTNGLADVGNPSSSSTLMFPTHSSEFVDLWKIEKTRKVILQPGKSIVMIQSRKDVKYDPSLYDSHALTYQKRFKCSAQLLRIQGVLAHDTTLDQQGHAPAGVDIVSKRKWVVKYDAGVDLNYIVLSDNYDSFTNGAVVSSYPVADNIGYSVA